ncbi:CTTNBP2 N-terminal like b isoform X4 [Narcine bancroftii]|uniref:CTTNBP2 N-terminal like b isoform X4 n=1 Tax=Narcine bancroftii TaxID=1343680 RepID=UPI003831BCC3
MASLRPEEAGGKKNANMNLENFSKAEILMFFSVLEGELEARDMVIEALQAQHKDRFIQERYGKYDISDPFLALQRDCDSIHDGNLIDKQPVCTNPLSVLKVVMAQCKKMQDRMLSQLAAAESRHRKVILDLEEERRRHAQDTAEGDDVTYMLEKERERLTQQSSEIIHERRRLSQHNIQMGNISNTFVDAGIKSSLCEIIGIEHDPEDLVTFCIRPEWRTHHQKYLNPLTTKRKTLLCANTEGLTGTGNIARISRMSARKSRRAMPLKQWVLITKSPRMKTTKFPSMFTTRNNDLHLSSTFNVYKHPKRLPGHFVGNKLLTAAKKLWGSVLKKHRSSITGNISTIITNNPGATIMRNTNEVLRMATVRNSPVPPTRSKWTKTANGSRITVAKYPRLTITKRFSTIVNKNPWRIISINPVENSISMSRTTNQHPMSMATRNPWMPVSSNSSSNAVKNPIIFLIKNSTNRSQSDIIKTNYTVTIQDPNKNAILKPNRSYSGNINSGPNQKSKMTTIQYPRRKITQKNRRMLFQKSSRIGFKNHERSPIQNLSRNTSEEVNIITTGSSNKGIIQKAKVNVFRRPSRRTTQSSITIITGNISYGV